ncbi:MAG TPA: gamma-glutamyl-gamma-aminobutyrate hydrolase family protein [Polyangia bacterium]|nr:gamma-glutamyl-gamma-aminobutyrate hydrolase family protein [Polyangia bacterium]
MKRAIVLQHTPTEGPERVAELLAARGLAIDVRHVYRGDAVPAHVEKDELVVAMGGPMGVGDVDDPRYPFLAPEILLLREAIARDRPVLGICLGAQLLAAAAGARVYPNTRRGADGALVPAREVGWGPVDFQNVAREPALAGMRAKEMVLHWHGDTFDLPRGATHLASTPVCRNQAFRLGWKAFALQFHCELSADAVGVWVREDAAYVREANGDEGGARILADTATYFAEARPVWNRLLGNIIGEMVGA